MEKEISREAAKKETSLNIKEMFDLPENCQLDAKTKEMLERAAEQIEELLEKPIKVAKRSAERATEITRESAKREYSLIKQSLEYINQFNDDFCGAAKVAIRKDELGGIQIIFTPEGNGNLGVLEKTQTVNEDGKRVVRGTQVGKVTLIIRTGEGEEANVAKTPLQINYRIADRWGREIQSLRIDIHNLADVPLEEQQVQVDATIGTTGLEIKHQAVEALPKGEDAVEGLRHLEYALALNMFKTIRRRDLGNNDYIVKEMTDFEKLAFKNLGVTEAN